MSGATARVGIVTCRVLPEPDPDQELLLDAFRARGVAAELLPWDDRDARPEEFDICVLRSCWNYMMYPADFEAWLARADAATRLWNPLPVARWNLRKTYLRQLGKQGIPVVPTDWIEAGSGETVTTIVDRHGWDDFVVKPIISAGSYRTRRFDRGELADAEAFVAETDPHAGWMVQPYLTAVEDHGERAIVTIDDEVTHAVRKSARFHDDEESVSEALVPDRHEFALARRCLDAVGEPLLYARVDVIPDDEGRLRLAELELLEPSLFLLQHPPALERLVDATLARLAGPA